MPYSDAGLKKGGPSGGRDVHRKNIRERLKIADLTRKRQSLLAREEVLGGRDRPSARLRSVLDQFGPIFSAFADYLSVRADLIPLADCLELGPRPGAAEFIPRRTVRGLLESELPQNHHLIQSLENAEWANTMFQWHRATLNDDQSVSIKILNPEFERQWRDEKETLWSLGSARVGLGDGTELDITTALTDFISYTERCVDLGLEAKGLTEMADAVRDFECFVVPAIHPELCTRRITTTAALSSARRLAAETEGLVAGNTKSDDYPEENTDTDLARRLSLLWLQQALLTSMYPEGPFEDDLVIMGDSRLGICGGLFGHLDNDGRQGLLQYLRAVAKDEPIPACDLLLEHCLTNPSATQRDAMRIRFRQAEPFRSGGWSDHYQGQRLADALFVQWRLAWQGGFRLQPHVEAFARGLFALERQARKISPEWDGLREGLNDVRIIASISRIRERISPTRLGEDLLEFIENGSLIMRKLAAGKSASEPTRSKAGPSRFHSLMWIAVSGLSLVLVSLALILERLTMSATPWMSEESAAIIFITVALGIIWYLRPAKDQ